MRTISLEYILQKQDIEEDIAIKLEYHTVINLCLHIQIKEPDLSWMLNFTKDEFPNPYGVLALDEEMLHHLIGV